VNRVEAWCVHTANLLVGATGLVYAVLRYLVEPSDPFAVVNHPLQPLAQHLHVWAAPLVVFAVGLVFRAHVWAHLVRGVPARRASGLAQLAAFVPMVASGYLIQTAVTPASRQAWVAVHLATSGLWLAGWAAHLLASRSGARAAAAASGEAPVPPSAGPRPGSPGEAVS
jgi:hypothetical protein